MKIRDSRLPSPTAGRYPASEDQLTARAKALESLLQERGLLESDTVDRIVRVYEQDVGPLLGAKVIAKAWVDPEYKKRLLEDGTKACAEIGVVGRQDQEFLVVLENTPRVHHVIVCTLCSCYPWPVLGLPPSWYKEPAYRSRMVLEPRKMLKEDFGLDLDEDVEIKVVDVSGEVDYFVLPERPAGTEDFTEEELAALVTRDSIIGVGLVAAPGTL